MLTDPPYKNRDEAVAGLKTQQKPGFNYGDVEDSPNTVSQKGSKPYSTDWQGPVTAEYPQGMPYDVWIKLPGSKKQEKKFVESRQDKISATYGQTNKQQNNVSNTKPTDTGNGNIATATATGGNASIGNINIGTGTGTGTKTGTQDGQKTTKQPGTPGSTLGVKDNNTGGGGKGSSSTTGNTRGYSGNSPFNQATASATGGSASIGDITINVPGGGSGGGSGAGPGGGGPGKISDLLGGIKPNMKQPAFKKTTGITQNTSGGKTPYKFRGLENQFQSWQMNRYDNDTTT